MFLFKKIEQCVKRSYFNCNVNIGFILQNEIQLKCQTCLKIKKKMLIIISGSFFYYSFNRYTACEPLALISHMLT